MKILIAPDKFKGSLNAAEVCDAITKGIKINKSKLEIISCPMADGGEGSIDIINNYLSLKPVELIVNDPLFRPIKTTYYFSDLTAYIEMSSASGLSLLKKEEQNCMNTSSFGTGELIKDAINKGLTTLNLYIGGSATNDGGVGIASALGFQFYDRLKKQLSPIGKNLKSIDHIDDSQVNFNFKEITFNVICDVDNPLYGRNGAAFVYARQKGANSLEIKKLDQGLINLQSILIKYNYPNVKNMPGSGAAGGVGGGLVSLLGAKLISGINNLIEITQVESKIKDSDIIITGEGKIDLQTEKGKVISGISSLARKYKKPVIAVCGEEEKNVSVKLGLKKVYTILEIADSVSDAIVNGDKYLIEIGTKILTDLKKNPEKNQGFAEKEGFEPPEV